MPHDTSQQHTKRFSGWNADQPTLRVAHRGYRFEMNFEIPTLKSPWPNEEDHTGVVSERLGIMRATYGDDPAMTQLYFYLGTYIEQDVPQDALDLIAQTMSDFRDQGVSVVLRFAYDHSFLPQVPYTADGIVRHIQQLGPIVRQYSDMISVWQAGFFGRWGEWGYSFYPLSTDPAVVNRVVEALVAELPTGVRSQVRYEAKRSLIEPHLRDAFGYHNDYLTLEGDMDLIDPRYDTWEHYLEVSEHHPMDYEMGWDSTQDVDDYPWDTILDPIAAARRLQTLRVDTYSVVHNAFSTLPHWRATQVSEQDIAAAGLPAGRDYFTRTDGSATTHTAFEYIRDHLGFRLEADELTYQVSDDGVDFDLTLTNRGFARPKRGMQVLAVIESADGSAIAELPLESDWQDWSPSGRSELDDATPAPAQHLSGRIALTEELPAGATLGIVIQDPTGSRRFAPRFANADVAYVGGVNRIATLTRAIDNSPAPTKTGEAPR